MNLKDFEKQIKMMSRGGNSNIPNIPDISDFMNPKKMFSNIKNGFKNWWKRNMKKIIICGSSILITVFSLKIMLSEKKGVYLVTDSLGIEYNTNQYKINGQCIEFNRNKKNMLITICGDFKIVKQQQQQKK